MQQLRILVAEDDAIVAEDLRQTLEEMGHRVPSVVHSGDLVAREAREQSIELALLDVRMPGAADGIDAGTRLHAELEIPVVYLTAYADDETLSRAWDSDPMAYLVKPVDPDQLRSVIELAARRHALESRLKESMREARLAQSALERSESRYRALFEGSPVAIHVIGLDEGRILDVNRRFEELFGWLRHEVMDRTVDVLGLWPNEAQRKSIAEEMAAGTDITGRRVRGRARTGPMRELEVSAVEVELDGSHRLLVLSQDVSERAAIEAELERLALHDTLTGLPNRALFKDRLAHSLELARREGRQVAVLFIDLDRFKVVNDTLGHEAGDHVLAQAAQRLRGCLREEDTVARLGGDEFAVVLEDPADDGAEATARRIQAALLTPFAVAGTEVHLSASIGIALSGVGDISDSDLTRFSDVAMFAAKRSGGGRHRVFDPSRDTQATERLHMENELRHALSADELRLLFQPIVSLETGRPVGAEALVRWEHPERGRLLPVDFLPMAEETGLIAPLGRWVVATAAKRLSGWQGRLPTDFMLTVNLSPRHLADPEVAEQLNASLGEHGIAPGLVTVEITEDSLLRAPGRIRKLRDLGIRIAIDDFGAGYSSFRYLKELEVDLLKIDRSFVTGLARSRVDALVVRSILLFAQGLDLDVVAEGIETAEQSAALAAVGCSLGQGFLFSRPVDGDELLALVLGGSLANSD